jgi:hypothetical protein
MFEVLANVPWFDLGIPVEWVEAKDLKTWPRLSEEGVVPFDPNDPPRYEAQAAYLERHGLLLPGERRLLRKRDFEPERVELFDETSVESGG